MTTLNDFIADLKIKVSEDGNHYYYDITFDDDGPFKGRFLKDKDGKLFALCYFDNGGIFTRDIDTVLKVVNHGTN